MAALDLPFLWIEVVGTVSDVLFPSQRYLAVRNQHIALRGFCRERKKSGFPGWEGSAGAGKGACSYAGGLSER